MAARLASQGIFRGSNPVAMTGENGSVNESSLPEFHIAVAIAGPGIHHCRTVHVSEHMWREETSGIRNTAPTPRTINHLVYIGNAYAIIKLRRSSSRRRDLRFTFDRRALCSSHRLQVGTLDLPIHTTCSQTPQENLTSKTQKQEILLLSHALQQQVSSKVPTLSPQHATTTFSNVHGVNSAERGGM